MPKKIERTKVAWGVAWVWALTLVFCLQLAGCVVVPVEEHVRVADWPQLKVVEHHVAEAEMRDQCLRFAPPFASAAGCTVIDFDRQEAHIYVSKDFPNPAVLRHERLHAAGHDHVRSNYLKRAWLAWKADNHRRQAALDAF